jgi:predicted RNase H-like nuclease (RuvC/YqgF family)
MKKPVQIILIAAVVLLGGTTALLYTQNQKTNQQLASTQGSEQEIQDRYGRTIQAIAEIQDSLNAVAVGPEGTPVFGGSQAQSERNAAGPNREEALERIAVLRNSIAQNKERIQTLETNVKKSGVKIKGLQNLISNLKKSVAEKEDQLALLNQQVEELHTQVNGLTETVAAREDTLRTRDMQVEEKRREVATVYYAVGSKKDLEKAGVIRSSGGVLGLGKTVLPTGVQSQSAFVPLDTDQQNVIVTSSPKAKVVSAQPVSSYRLLLVDGHMELHIVSPAEFRKVKQVVILTS